MYRHSRASLKIIWLPIAGTQKPHPAHKIYPQNIAHQFYVFVFLIFCFSYIKWIYIIANKGALKIYLRNWYANQLLLMYECVYETRGNNSKTWQYICIAKRQIFWINMDWMRAIHLKVIHMYAYMDKRWGICGDHNGFGKHIENYTYILWMNNTSGRFILK